MITMSVFRSSPSVVRNARITLSTILFVSSIVMVKYHYNVEAFYIASPVTTLSLPATKTTTMIGFANMNNNINKMGKQLPSNTIGRQQQPNQPWVISTKSSSFSVTRLNMGVMEDFLTGQDSSTRSKENKSYLEQLNQRVQRINELESTIEELDDDELQSKTMEFHQRLQTKKEDINGVILEEAFAVVREAAWYVCENIMIYCSFFDCNKVILNPFDKYALTISYLFCKLKFVVLKKYFQRCFTLFLNVCIHL